MICTDCNCETNQTVSNWAKRYGKALVQKIMKDERLCLACATKRGYGGLAKIHHEREIQAAAGRS